MDNTSLFFGIFNLSRQSAVLDQFMIFTTKYLIDLSFIAIFIIAYFGKAKERKALLLILLAVPISILLILLIHIFIKVPRPFVTFSLQPLTDTKPDASFPSRHTTLMAVIAFCYAYFKSKWALFFFIATVLVGISRIYVGVHYPADILGGLIVGILAVLAAQPIISLLKKKLFSE